MSWIVLIALGTIWGASYLFIKIGGAEIPPITFVAGRTSIAALALFVTMLARGERIPPLNRKVWIPLFALGIFNSVVPYTLITWGETQISSGLAGILVGTMPIFTVLLAHWITHDEKLNANKIVGVIVAFVGVIILFFPELQGGLKLSLAGELAVVLAAMSYAFAAIVAHKYVEGISHLAAPFGQLLIGAVVLAPLSLIVDQPWNLNPSLPAVASLLTLAVGGTAFAYLLYFWLIEQSGATVTSLVTYISPVSAVILGAVVLHESLDWTAVVGLFGIIAGVALVTRKEARVVAIPAAVEAE